MSSRRPPWPPSASAPAESAAGVGDGERGSGVKEQPVVEIEHWRGVDPSTGQRDTDRYTIVHEGRSVLTFGSEAECLAAIRENRWRTREQAL